MDETFDRANLKCTLLADIDSKSFSDDINHNISQL